MLRRGFFCVRHFGMLYSYEKRFRFIYFHVIVFLFNVKNKTVTVINSLATVLLPVDFYYWSDASTAEQAKLSFLLIYFDTLHDNFKI